MPYQPKSPDKEESEVPIVSVPLTPTSILPSHNLNMNLQAHLGLHHSQDLAPEGPIITHISTQTSLIDVPLPVVPNAPPSAPVLPVISQSPLTSNDWSILINKFNPVSFHLFLSLSNQQPLLNLPMPLTKVFKLSLLHSQSTQILLCSLTVSCKWPSTEFSSPYQC